jgi:hypothetical protein
MFMKKFFQMVAFASLTVAMSACYNDDELWNKVDELETKVEANASDIAALSALVDALNNGKVIVGTQQTENGYVLTFNDGSQVSVLNGKDGADGKDGANGKDGESGANGDSFFTSIEETDDIVIITLADGRVIKLPKALDYELRVLTFEDEDTKFTPYSLDYANKTISKWSELVDDAQYGGTLTYNNYGEATYYWYDENNTEIEHSFTTPYWGGGHAISNFVIENYETLPNGYYGWYELQFATPIGGHNNSKNFCVHNGYQDDYNSQIYDGKLAWFSFKGGKEQVVDHMFVTNTCYVLNSLMYGDGFNSPATDDTWVKIVAYGYNANEEEVGTSEFYLCNTGRRFVTDWQKWDLSSLGKVNKIVFNFAASDDQIGSYGLNCPAYFAYDDVAIQFTE